MRLLMVGSTTPSHVYPSLALIAELVARGHEVQYVIGDRLGELVAATGAEVVGHPTLLPDSDTAWPDDTGEAMQVFLDEQIRVLEDPLRERVRAPDAVLYDIGGFAGRAAAHRWGVRAVQLSPTYVAWEGYEQDMAEHTAALKASPSGRRYFETLGRWLDRNEIPIGGDDFLGRPEACVVLIPRVLQPNGDRVGPQYAFAGPCIDERRRTGWAPSSGDERPLAYVSLGTSYTDRPGFYRDCVSALAADHRLILSTGKVDPAVLEPLPDGVSAARTQPQLDILDHADVFVTHAGMGSTVESLWYGVPTVAVPQAVDQFVNAAQLEAIGAGVQLAAADATPETLRGAVSDALGRAGRVRDLRDEVRRQGGVAIAADVTERLCASAA